ncbi:trissin receptor-like [Asterias rubens]|uniref:trissin receptor-like n=1 Tax=Asterias rubens TaxID=7604 RepID=UPI0014555849|nr:trissin receptor-like [Asterias rubens]
MTDLGYSFSSSLNETEMYDDPYVQSPLKETIILSYSLTFFFGFLGNLLVIFVIARNRSMHTVTNFFLANLAVADLFVSLFCTIPKLLWFVSSSWEYGDFLCKFHNYAMSVTTTSSIFILTVISMERFIAILRPLETRRLLTAGRLTVAMATVWIASVLFNIHSMWYFHVDYVDGVPYCIPNVKMTSPHVKIQTVVFFCIYYVIPLMVMVILYGLIGHKLWVSSKLRLTASDCEKPDRPKRNIITRLAGVRDIFKRRNQTPAPSCDAQKQANNGGNVDASRQGPPGTFEEAQVLIQTQISTKSEENPETQKIGPFFLDEPDEDSGQMSPAVDQSCIYKPKGDPDHEISIRIEMAGNKKEETRETTLTESRNGPVENNACKVTTNNNQSKASDAAPKVSKPRRPFSAARPLTISKSEKSKHKKSKKKETVSARKKVIKLLVVVVSSFALCLLPYQIVALVLPFGSIHIPPFFNPMIYLCYFFNSALNPFLYAFLSDNFRKRMRETLTLRSSTRQRQWKQTQWRMRSMTEATETETVYTSS